MPSLKNNTSPLIWIDLEMTGLIPEMDKILEIAVILTDSELNPLDEGINLVIHQSEKILTSMNNWCIKQHGKSGLTQLVRESTIDISTAEKYVLSYIKEKCPEGLSPLCGNSVGHDKRFLEIWMPTLTTYLHYRIVDVSTIKELAKRWYPKKNPLAKKGGHRALDDILESIEELRWYKTTIFR